MKKRIEISLSLRDRYKRAAGAFSEGVESAKGNRRYTGIVDLARQQRMEEAEAAAERRSRYSTDAEQEDQAQNSNAASAASGNSTVGFSNRASQSSLAPGTLISTKGLGLISPQIQSRFQTRSSLKDGGVQKTPGEFSHSKNLLTL